MYQCASYSVKTVILPIMDETSTHSEADDVSMNYNVQQ
jgi:hypothetical protein